MLTLLLTQGAQTQSLKLEQDLITIGRSKENTIVIPNKKVSRKHARIERVGATYQVTDLESGNGTRINGEKVGFHALSKGDEIKVGDALLKVQGIDEGPDRIELDDKVGEETGMLDTETPVDGAKTEPQIQLSGDEDEIKISGEDDAVTVVEKFDDLPPASASPGDASAGKPAPAPKAAPPAPKPAPKLSPPPGAKPAAGAKPGSPSRLEAAKAKLAALKEKKAQGK